MLSILIPTYNYVCLHLVKHLYSLAKEAGIVFEIIVADDASTEASTVAANKEIGMLSGCRYILSECNRGPARIRNYLAGEATFPLLLFMDSDVFPVKPTFITDYLKSVDGKSVIHGGLKYKRHTPSQAHALRYYYGTKVEERSVKTRKENPYRNFTSVCFLVSKEVFFAAPFDETMHFGYEDVVYGMQLQKKEIPVIHIDNPVYHSEQGESSEQYLQKIQLSVKNLVEREESLRSHVKLLKAYSILNKLHLIPLIRCIFAAGEKSIVRNLTGRHPSLKLFAFYKLGYFCRFSSHRPTPENNF